LPLPHILARCALRRNRRRTLDEAVEIVARLLLSIV
jgi:hypothetical protein